jgi:hypothetical protein
LIILLINERNLLVGCASWFVCAALMTGAAAITEVAIDVLMVMFILLKKSMAITKIYATKIISLSFCGRAFVFLCVEKISARKSVDFQLRNKSLRVYKCF